MFAVRNIDCVWLMLTFSFSIFCYAGLQYVQTTSFQSFKGISDCKIYGDVMKSIMLKWEYLDDRRLLCTGMYTGSYIDK